jgi:hypothetical protein
MNVSYLADYDRAKTTSSQRILSLLVTLVSWDGVRRPLTGLLYQPRMIHDECGAVGGIKIRRGNKSIRRKLAPVPLCQPKIPYDLIWARTRATTIGSRRLSSWAMARPVSCPICEDRLHFDVHTWSTICYVKNEVYNWIPVSVIRGRWRLSITCKTGKELGTEQGKLIIRKLI